MHLPAGRIALPAILEFEHMVLPTNNENEPVWDVPEMQAALWFSWLSFWLSPGCPVNNYMKVVIGIL